MPQAVGYNQTPPPPIQWLYSEAEALDVYATGAVPGLLPSRRYALAAGTQLVDPRTPPERERLGIQVESLIQRQELVVADHLTPITAVIDEHALHRPLGGLDTLAEQVAHLHRVATDDTTRVGIRILPSDAHSPFCGSPATFPPRCWPPRSRSESQTLPTSMAQARGSNGS